MTTLTIGLPDQLAWQAQDAGLLTSEAVAQLLREAMRRQAGQRLLNAAQRLQTATIQR